MALKHYCVSLALNGKFLYAEETEVLFNAESSTSILKTSRKGNSPETVSKSLHMYINKW